MGKGQGLPCCLTRYLLECKACKNQVFQDFMTSQSNAKLLNIFSNHPLNNEKVCFFFFILREFVESHWCLEEFSQAYHQVVEGRLNYIIVVLLEKPAPNKLPPELETYLTTHTYIDARTHADELGTIRKRIRFAMPKVPLTDLLVRNKFNFNKFPI